MKLSEFKSILTQNDQLDFRLENGERVPAHFHITEVGSIDKKFIDCGGQLRNEQKISFQLYVANDVDHRLSSKKLESIVDLSIRKLNLPDSEIEVEYQDRTIGKYGLDFDGESFVLSGTETDCLAKDSCGIEDKRKVSLEDLSSASTKQACCDPASGCC